MLKRSLYYPRSRNSVAAGVTDNGVAGTDEVKYCYFFLFFEGAWCKVLTGLVLLRTVTFIQLACHIRSCAFVFVT